MNFPEIKIDDWNFEKDEDLWIDFSNGVQKYAGRSMRYEKKANKNSDFKQLLLQYDVYGRGVIAMTWLLFELKNGEFVLIRYVSKVFKDGKWITGILDHPVNFSAWKDADGGKVCGFKLSIQTGPNIFSEVFVRKSGDESDEKK